ncbi:MAG: discoidin domain-containing protein, partial [Thermoguttaceae bacterium]
MYSRFFVAPLLAIACLPVTQRVFAETKTVTVKVSVDSEAPGYEGFRALDGNPETMWHTMFGGANPACPHQITVDLGSQYEITGISYLPRVGGGNGTIRDYELYISNNPKDSGR